MFDSPTPDPVQRRPTNLSIVVGFNPPQLHNNMVRSYAEAGACIIKVIDSIPNNKKATIPKLAKYLDVPAQRLWEEKTRVLVREASSREKATLDHYPAQSGCDSNSATPEKSEKACKLGDCTRRAGESDAHIQIVISSLFYRFTGISN